MKEEAEPEIKEVDEVEELISRLDNIYARLEELHTRVQVLDESLQTLATDGIYINDIAADDIKEETKDLEDIELKDLDFKL